MRRVITILILIQIHLINFGQIIADHTVVDKYDKIPQQYIDKVKKMLVDIAGESHSAGYRNGMALLAAYDPRFQVLIYAGERPAYTSNYLRFGIHESVGEEDLYVTQAVIDAYKSHITSQNSTGNEYSVMGYAWCSDMYYLLYGTPLGSRDPVYNIPWYGESIGGADGNRPWGVDSGDSTLTGNRVNMNRYLNAVEQINQHSVVNGYSTRFIFTTGPVDNLGGSGNLEATQQGFQREVKHDYIRNYVLANGSGILFDYADILCWNNSGVKYMTNWNDNGTIRPHANIHPDNTMDYDASWNIISPSEDGDHIGEVGALRLSKAMWWLLARIAGWDGVTYTTDIKDLGKDSSLPYHIERSRDEMKIIIDAPILSANAYLYNFNGTIIDSKKITGNSCIFTTSHLPTGIYLMVLSHSGIFKTEKIFIH